DELADHPPDDLAGEHLPVEARVLALDRPKLLGEERHVGELLERQEARAQAVVDVVVVVCDLVRDVRDLRLETGLAPLDEAAADVAELDRVAQRAVLQDAFPGLERAVQARERGVALPELVDAAPRL